MLMLRFLSRAPVAKRCGCHNFKGNLRGFNTSLTETNLKFQQMVRKYAEENLKPIAAELDRDCRFPAKQIKEMAQMGLLGMCVSKKWNGSEMGLFNAVLAVEEIAKICGGTGSIVAIHNCLFANAVETFGTDEQKEKFLKPCAEGNLGTFALSEPDAGSDVVNLSTTATPDGDNFILNGTKAWVTSATEAKTAIIFATIDKKLKHKGITAFLVPVPSPGLRVSPNLDKIGARAASLCNFCLENVKVPKSNVLGQVGNGFKIAMVQIDKARIGISCYAVGLSQGAFDIALEYASKRKTSNRPLTDLQLIKARLTDMAIKISGARLLAWHAAFLCEQNKKFTREASMAKLNASLMADSVTNSAIQIMGGYGILSSSPAMRFYRDARLTQIKAGVTDLHQLLVADLLVKERKL